MICVIRMNPAWVLVWPKFAPFTLLAPCSVRTLTRLNKLSVSIFNCADLSPPRRKFLMNDASTLRCVADRASVMVRGEAAVGIVGVRVVLRRPRDVVVAVQGGRGGGGGVEVAFGKLVVLQHAVGVAHAAADAMRQTLAPLDDGRVVQVLPLGHVTREDVVELRIWPEQLTTLQRRRREERRPGKSGVPLEWVGHRRRERGRSERHVLRIELVDVDRGVVRSAEAKVVAFRTNVAQRDRHVARQLALEVNRVLLHAGRGAVLIDVADARADAGPRPE